MRPPRFRSLSSLDSPVSLPLLLLSARRTKPVFSDSHMWSFYRTEYVVPSSSTVTSSLQKAKKQNLTVKINHSSISSRSKLQRHSQWEDQLVACSKSEEPLLDKLPCLYRSVAPDSWCDQTSLLTGLRTIIWEEQKKIVWVEPDLWWNPRKQQKL